MAVPRFMMIALSAVLFGAGLAGAPAQAQDGDGESINQLIIYGDDPCPASTTDQITVCARKDESERYRIPEILRQSQDPANDAWNNRVLAYETVLDSGTLSCSPTGGGGWFGCTQDMIRQAYAEKKTDATVRFSELIAEERARRLATIDAEAAEQQARVEEAERAYLEQNDTSADEPASGQTE